ncbi:MAG: Transcriptional regulator, TetR family [Myxococcaceae bacterium]|nr:Transcriptional regulator, TetR family [Myxococcaceae bacterium]
MLATYTWAVARSKEQGVPKEQAVSKVADKGGRYHHGDLRRALIEAAFELVKEHGPAGITLREAARRAGVTHAAPYRHFADKEALLAALAEEGFTRLRGEIEQAIVGVPRAELLEVIGVVYVRFARQNPSQFRVMFGAEMGDKRRYPSLTEADQAVFDLLCGAIRAAQEVGIVAPGNPARLGMVQWSMLHGVAALIVDGQMERAGVREEHLDEFARRVARTGIAGLRQWNQNK